MKSYKPSTVPAHRLTDPTVSYNASGTVRMSKSACRLLLLEDDDKVEVVHEKGEFILTKADDGFPLRTYNSGGKAFNCAAFTNHLTMVVDKDHGSLLLAPKPTVLADGRKGYALLLSTIRQRQTK